MSTSFTNISRRELLLGSAAAGTFAMLGRPVISLAAQGGGVAPLNSIDGLADLLRGDLITPEDGRYDDARMVWNAMIDKHPAAIARCSGVADIVNVVNYARERQVDVTVRGGGHNVAGKSLRDGAITIDLSPMHGVWVDQAAKRAHVQGGARWGLVDRETLAHGLYTTGGTVSDTGVGGLTLGGGFGWLMRKHGLSCDNVVSANIVTADGRHIKASATENADLYWAIRGGGGNFGVVTSFEFRLHEAQPITGGMALFTRDKFRDMLHFYRDYTASAPDELAAQCGALVGPPGSPVDGQVAGWFAICYAGPPEIGARLVQPVKDLGPAADFIGPSTYIAQQTMFDAGMSIPLQNYWRSNFINELSDDLIEFLVEHVDEIPRPASLLLLEHMEGAVARVGENETAFANRGAKFNLSLLGAWTDPADNDKNIAWVRNIGDELRTFATGGAYVNYMASDESPERVRAAYEANFKRLVEVKGKYDPTNFWSGNQNIAP